MKKYFLSMLTMAAMLLSVSCSKDDVDANKNATVSFDITTSELVTRAYGDGKKALLMYAVYDETANSTVVEGVSKLYPVSGIEFDDDLTAQVNLSLLSGNEYSILFWATSADYDDAYSINWNSKTVTMESEIPGNTEAFDSFFHYESKFKVNGSISKPITLVRPFAQLNIGTNDKTQAAAANLDVTETKVVVKSVPNILDVTDGSVSGDTNITTNITYSYGDVPEEDNNNKFPVNDYSYLAMNYVLVGTDKIFSDIELSYKNSDGSKEFTNIYPSIPLQRNYRTNVYGSILTNSADYGVEIKPGFGENDDQEHNKDVGITANVDNANDFITAFNTLNDTDADNDVNTIILTGDVDLGNLNDLISNYMAVNPSANIVTRAGETPATLTIPAGKELILDLRGFNITGTDTTEKNFQIIDNRGTLTIKNSDDTKEEPSYIKVNATNNSGWNRYSAAIANNPGGNLTVGKNVLIEHLGGTDMAYGIDNLTNGKGTSAVTTIDGATIKSTYAAVRQFLNGTEATNELYVNAGSLLESPKRAIFFQSPNTDANSGKLVVAEGAKIYGEVRLSATAGTTEWPVEVSIAASALIKGSQVTGANIPSGFEVKNVNGTWTIAAIVVAKIGDTDYYSLQDAIDDVQAGDTITLTGDVEVSESLVIREGVEVTLNLNGKTLSGDNTQADGPVIKNEGTLTIIGGTISSTAENGPSAVYNSGTLTLENATIVGAQNGTSGNASYAVNTTGAGSKLTVKNSSISGRGAVGATNGTKVEINGGTYHTPYAHWGHAVYASGAGTEVVINGGTFTEGYEYANDLWGMYQIYAGDKAKVIVNNGDFSQKWDCANGYDLATADKGVIEIKGGVFADNPSSQDGKNYVAAGYITIQQTDGTYKIEPIIKEGVSEIELGDAHPYATIVVDGNITIKGDTNVKAITSTTGGTITIEDGKTLTLNNFSFGSGSNPGQTYKIEGGTVIANYGFFQHGTYELHSDFETGYMYYSYGSDITVYGTFHSQGKGDGLDYVRGKLTIAKGGKSLHDKSLWVGQPASWGAMTASLIIEDGGYVQANSLSVHEGSSLTYYNDADLKYNSLTGTITKAE